MIIFDAEKSTPTPCLRVKFSHEEYFDRRYYTGMYSPDGEYFAEGLEAPIKNVLSWSFYSIQDENDYLEKIKSSHKSKRYFRIGFVFKWYDLWVGAYWDKKKRWLYILPIPTIGIILKFKK